MEKYQYLRARAMKQTRKENSMITPRPARQDVKREPSRRDFGTPESCFGVPRFDFGAPGSRFGAPRFDFCTPGSRFGVPKFDFGAPKPALFAPRTLPVAPLVLYLLTLYIHECPRNPRATPGFPPGRSLFRSPRLATRSRRAPARASTPARDQGCTNLSWCSRPREGQVDGKKLITKPDAYGKRNRLAFE